MIKLYSTHCPRCNVITRKLNAKNIQFEEITSLDEMKALGFQSVPILEVDGVRMNFSEANKWINQQEG